MVQPGLLPGRSRRDEVCRRDLKPLIAAAPITMEQFATRPAEKSKPLRALAPQPPPSTPSSEWLARVALPVSAARALLIHQLASKNQSAVEKRYYLVFLAAIQIAGLAIAAMPFV